MFVEQKNGNPYSDEVMRDFNLFISKIEREYKINIETVITSLNNKQQEEQLYRVIQDQNPELKAKAANDYLLKWEKQLES